MTLRPASGTRVETLLGQIADEFTDRLQRGVRPDIDEFLRRYPELSGVLRQVLPALLVIQDSSGPLPGTSQADSSLPEGRTLDDFRLLREIARGGMGIVYEAEQISLSRRVALKILPLAAALDPRALARFRIEAQAAAQLHHTHIVPVYSVGCDRGVHYYAMQFIEGTTLAQVIAQLRELAHPGLDITADCSRKPPPEPSGRPSSAGPAVSTKAALTTAHAADRAEYWRMVARLGIQAAEGLDYAHQRGVIHRDIKPANLLLDQFQNLWITDFGLARMGAETQLTLTGDLLGTWAYLSPESISPGANRLLVDHRTDVYSLGATLYELLTLQPAFGGDNRAEILRRIAHEEPQAPRACDRRIPVELETIVLKALEKRPEERYGSAQELADDLRRFLEHRPIHAQRPRAWDRLRKWSRRHRALVLGTIAVMVVMTLGTAVAGWRMALIEAQAALDRAEAEKQRRLADFNSQFAKQQKQLADHQQTLAEARLAHKRWSHYATQINLAANAWKAGQMDQAREYLAACCPQSAEPDLRGFEWWMLSRACRDHSVWNRHRGEVYFARFSPNGRFVATAGQDGVRIWTWENGGSGKSGQPVAHLVAHQQDVNAVGWSPDSRQLVTAGDDDTARVWDTETWQVLKVLEHAGHVCGAHFSPEGSLLATAERRQLPQRQDGSYQDEGQVRLWDALTWQPLAALHDPGPGMLQGLDFSPDGKLLATAGRGNAAVVWDVAQRSIRYRFEQENGVNCVAFSRDQPLLATGSSGKHQISFWNVNDGSLAQVLNHRSHTVESIAFAPDGQSLVTAGRDSDLVVWEMGRSLSQSGHMLRSMASFWCAVYAPDNETILTTSVDGGLRLFQGGDEPFDHHRFSMHHPGPRARARVTFSQDSQLIAQTGRNARIVDARQLLKSETQLNLPRVPGDDFPWLAQHILFSAKDGRFVLSGPVGRIGLWRLQTGEGEAIQSFVGLIEGQPYELTECAATDEFWMTVAWSADRHQTYAVSTDPKQQSNPHPIEWLEGAKSLTLGPDHRQLVVLSGDDELRLQDVPSGQIVSRVPGVGLNFLTWSSDGRRLAAATNQGTIELRTMPTLQREFVWAGHPKGIASLAFSRDNQTLAGALADGRVRLWNVITGMELVTLDTDYRLDQVQFSPDGKLLGAAGSHDQPTHELLLWHADGR